VDVVAAARDLDINVYTQHLSDSISGILRRDKRLGGPSVFVILVNSGHHPNRQRFTVAHELGHFMLHRSRAEAEGGIQDDEFYRALSGPQETQANQFAADLLMPWPLIKALQDQGTTGLESLARALSVSQQTMAIRLNIPYAADWS
jgi:Zn-dependent peptidase ImmA (M78 family)